MSSEPIEDMWDECRDGELTGSRRHVFDQQMLDDAELRALWGAESRWLEELKSPPAADAESAAPGFSERVLARWDQARRRRELIRQFWRRSRFAVGGAAAAALVTLMTWTYHGQGSTGPGQIAELDPVTILVADMAEQVQGPPEYLHAFRDTGRMFSFEQALRAFVVPASAETSELVPRQRSQRQR